MPFFCKHMILTRMNQSARIILQGGQTGSPSCNAIDKRRSFLNKGSENIKKYAAMLRKYFLSSTEESTVPSFSKFARGVNMTLSELEALRKDPEFDRIWLDCIEIRRDYLIDKALTRSCDPSFVRFILSGEAGTEDDKGEDSSIEVTIKVIKES